MFELRSACGMFVSEECLDLFVVHVVATAIFVSYRGINGVPI